MDGMDMDGMDMEGMGGMDDDGMFRPYSQWLATVYWYLITACIGAGLILHLFQLIMAKIRYFERRDWRFTVCFFYPTGNVQKATGADASTGCGSFKLRIHNQRGHKTGLHRHWPPSQP